MIQKMKHPTFVIVITALLFGINHAYELRVVKVQMGTQDGDGMDGGFMDIKFFGGGEFEFEICNLKPKNCCQTGELNSEDNNWEVGEVNYFIGRQLGGCKNFNISEEASDQKVTLKVTHSGPDGGKIQNLTLFGSRQLLHTYHTCKINKKLDNSEEDVFDCDEKVAEDEYENTCNGHSKFCDLKFDQVTFAGAHNAGTGMSYQPIADCFVTNQDLSLTEMLDFGLRFFDFDIKYDESTSELVTGWKKYIIC